MTLRDNGGHGDKNSLVFINVQETCKTIRVGGMSFLQLENRSFETSATRFEEPRESLRGDENSFTVRVQTNFSKASVTQRFGVSSLGGSTGMKIVSNSEGVVARRNVVLRTRSSYVPNGGKELINVKSHCTC